MNLELRTLNAHPKGFSDRVYLEKAEYLIDPWGKPYLYILTDNNFKIVSLGADGIEGL